MLHLVVVKNVGDSQLINLHNSIPKNIKLVHKNYLKNYGEIISIILRIINGIKFLMMKKIIHFKEVSVISFLNQSWNYKMLF